MSEPDFHETGELNCAAILKPVESTGSINPAILWKSWWFRMRLPVITVENQKSSKFYPPWPKKSDVQQFGV